MGLHLGGKGDVIKRMVFEHLQQVEAAVAAMAGGIMAYLAGKPWEEVEELAAETHRREGRADDVRREVELELVEGALLAGSRRSLLNMIDAADRLANAAEATMDCLVLQRIPMPELIHPLVREIVEVTVEQVADVKAAVEKLLEGEKGVVQRAEEVEHKEGRVDDLERRCMSRLFATDIPLAEKLLVRDFVERLVEISDRAEDLSDLIVTAMAVRRP